MAKFGKSTWVPLDKKLFIAPDVPVSEIMVKGANSRGARLLVILATGEQPHFRERPDGIDVLTQAPSQG